jgi:DNA gyrase subunit A
MKLTEKTGDVVATFPVTDDHQVMLISNLGQMIRTPVDTVRYTGRSASGVTLFKVADDEKVVSVAWLVEDDDDVEGEVGADSEVKADTDIEASPTEE